MPAVPGVQYDAGGSVVLPLTRANLELVRDALAITGDRERASRALNFIGRSVDLIPAAAATPAALASGSPSKGGAGGSGGVPPLPLSIPPMPTVHASDPLYLSVLEPVVAGILDRVTLAAASNTAAAVAPDGTAAAPALDAQMLQVALSVIRKLFRNAPSYMVRSCGAVLHALVAAARHLPKDLATTVERTVDEVVERMPAEVALTHLVACIVAAPGECPPVVIAAYRALTRIVTRLPPMFLVSELEKGRLMQAIAAHFLSTSTDVRRAVVQILVQLHVALGAALARYVEAYLTTPQRKLLNIYIEKETSAAATSASGGGAASASSAAASARA